MLKKCTNYVLAFVGLTFLLFTLAVARRLRWRMVLAADRRAEARRSCSGRASSSRARRARRGRARRRRAGTARVRTFAGHKNAQRVAHFIQQVGVRHGAVAEIPPLPQHADGKSRCSSAEDGDPGEAYDLGGRIAVFGRHQKREEVQAGEDFERLFQGLAGLCIARGVKWGI
jgi:hypothetical protein